MNTLAIYNYNVYPSAYGIRTSKAAPSNSNNVNFRSNVLPTRKSTTIGDLLMKQLIDETRSTQARATMFLDVVESIANELTKHGVSFDRAYCERHPVKSNEACMTKMQRSGSLKIPDLIRTTLYCKNLNDLSILSDYILPAFEKRGYSIAETEVLLSDLMKKGYVPKHGEVGRKEIKVPDIDIRINDVSDQVTKLPERLRAHSISHAQGSGYEDIQIRFINKYDPKRNQKLHELIILCGKNYSNAKHWDSTKLYDFTRQFGEMKFLIDAANDDKDIVIAKRYISLIRNLISSEISKKAFENAKNLDMYGIEDGLPIKVLSDDIKLLKNYFIEIEAKVDAYYQKERAKCVNNKTKLRNVLNNQKEDKKRLSTIRDGLLEAIDFYNKGGNLKEPVYLD